MKKIIFLAFISVSAYSQQVQYPYSYNCIPQYDNYYEDIKITVYSPTRFLINETDDGYLDESYKPTPHNKNFVRVAGYLKSIGDGAEGYSVELLVNNYILNGAKVGYMKYRASGADGFYDDVLKCEKL